MPYERTYHKNALLKLVKEKRMILQIDASAVMNNKDISYAAESLSKEGKIKREKVKIRYKNGNLNDAWLLYIPGINRNEILDYEKLLINKPFESPLKQYHCYKKIESPIKSQIEVMDVTNFNSNSEQFAVLRNDVIPIYDHNSERIINARELHEFLHVGKDFSNWIKDRIDRYDFTENEEYRVFTKSGENSKGGRPKKEYYLTMDTAKEIAMVENNERGRYIRKYFIQIEKEYKLQILQPKTNSIQALEMVVQELKRQDQRIDGIELKLKMLAE